eukprot:CAMPEP_0204257868 /NCGR_PEP_ID=MMETSP0468-20130131/4685_1 /ASSEMBLY_ACC=CAM_ASM_000383 /TAXON_ID=2969 /ORGANISM="Oxyrrhis marina" /LENGTH=292 /DNA_ID=CAMNT_0051232033 /DNA_START=113 /DNA_END=993 /DNA_ORIENTATION=+
MQAQPAEHGQQLQWSWAQRRDNRMQLANLPPGLPGWPTDLGATSYGTTATQDDEVCRNTRPLRPAFHTAQQVTWSDRSDSACLEVLDMPLELVVEKTSQIVPPHLDVQENASVALFVSRILVRMVLSLKLSTRALRFANDGMQPAPTAIVVPSQTPTRHQPLQVHQFPSRGAAEASSPLALPVQALIVNEAARAWRCVAEHLGLAPVFVTGPGWPATNPGLPSWNLTEQGLHQSKLQRQHHCPCALPTESCAGVDGREDRAEASELAETATLKYVASKTNTRKVWRGVLLFH